MLSRNFSKYISMNHSLLCEPRRICNTNGCTLMDKTQLVDLFERTDFNNVKELDCPLFPELSD